MEFKNGNFKSLIIKNPKGIEQLIDQQYYYTVEVFRAKSRREMVNKERIKS